MSCVFQNDVSSPELPHLHRFVIRNGAGNTASFWNTQLITTVRSASDYLLLPWYYFVNICKHFGIQKVRIIIENVYRF
jgi:hypothetical protein